MLLYLKSPEEKLSESSFLKKIEKNQFYDLKTLKADNFAGKFFFSVDRGDHNLQRNSENKNILFLLFLLFFSTLLNFFFKTLHSP
jgi:hypothetical protein